jgi:hypothetical protein
MLQRIRQALLANVAHPAEFLCPPRVFFRDGEEHFGFDAAAQPVLLPIEPVELHL